MSIDYSDMAYRKPKWKKKKQKHKKSILKSQKGVCFLCALLYDDYSKTYTEEHRTSGGVWIRSEKAVRS